MELNFRTLRPGEIDCRVSQINQNGLSLLLYKDARCDMTLLDETVGPMNWSRKHSRDNANCTVSIRGDDGEWVSKEDTGTESNTEAAKGLASDSFKRACVNWGIGRELYTAPFIWVNGKNCTIKEGRNGKPSCYDRFRVTAIDYNESREIVSLEITNMDTGNVCFSYGAVARHEGQNPPQKKPPQEDPKYLCADCGEEVADATFPDGQVYSARQIATGAYKAYRQTLCAKCYTARRAKGSGG